MVNLARVALFEYSFATEVIILASSMVLIILGVRGKDKMTRNISLGSILVLVFSLFVLTKFGVDSVNPIGMFYKVSGFIISMKAVTIICAIISLLMYIGHLNYNVANRRFEYPIILLLSVVGMLVMISANDFLSLYIGLELQSLAIYILTAMNRDNLKSSEAGLKYFVLGALASGILLYGISLIYGFSGSIYFSDIGNLFIDKAALDINLGLLVGMVMVLVALFFKIAAVPFYMWAPDVYEGSPTPVTLFISTAPKVAGFVILYRVLAEPFVNFYDHMQQIIIFVAVASLIVGALVAIRQMNLKRLIAYSSINHVGFILLGVVAMGNNGLQAMVLYLVLYLTMNFGIFAFLMLVKQSHNSTDLSDKKPLEDISTYAGIGKSMPLVAIGMTILLLSMACIPPFAGFFGKFFIFKVMVESELYWIAVVAAISAVIAAFYYLKIIKIMFFEEEVEEYKKKPNFIIVLVYAILVLFNLFFFINPDMFFDILSYNVGAY
jgi:NADH-quinone oxidoreductase subunit N